MGNSFRDCNIHVIYWQSVITILPPLIWIVKMRQINNTDLSKSLRCCLRRFRLCWTKLAAWRRERRFFGRGWTAGVVLSKQQQMTFRWTKYSIFCSICVDCFDVSIDWASARDVLWVNEIEKKTIFMIFDCSSINIRLAYVNYQTFADLVIFEIELTRHTSLFTSFFLFLRAPSQQSALIP